MTAPEPDGGLQYERTAMAHWRTMLAAAIAGLLIVRQSDPGAERAIAVIGVAAALLMLGTVGFRRQAALHRAEAPARHREMAGVVIGLLVMQTIAVFVVL